MPKQSLSQTTKITIGQKLSPAQIQASNLIAIPILSLKDAIDKEIEENPALEIDDAPADAEDTPYDTDDVMESDEDGSEDDDSAREIDAMAENMEDYYNSSDEYDEKDVSDYELRKINQSKDDKPYERVAVSEKSFQEMLLEQLAMMKISAQDRRISEYLVGNLNENGFFESDNNTLVNDILVSENIKLSPDYVEHIITSVIQRLEPCGVGARNVKECMLLQMENFPPRPPFSVAKLLVERFFNELEKKHYDQIMKRTELTQEELREALDVIKGLNQHPVDNQSVQDEAANYITPDFTMILEGDSLKLTLNNSYTPKLKINDYYAQGYKKLQEVKSGEKTVSDEIKKTAKFVKEYVDKANVFINSLSIRELTLERTMREIMLMQEAYFKTGDVMKIKPMILQDIADKTGYDKSTISRVTKDKYVQTFFGNIALKSLFSESVGDEETSSKEVKNIIKQLIDEENTPLSDDKLCGILNEKGYEVKRRTVAKYRDDLGIPVARLRKKL